MDCAADSSKTSPSSRILRLMQLLLIGLVSLRVHASAVELTSASVMEQSIASNALESAAAHTKAEHEHSNSSIALASKTSSEELLSAPYGYEDGLYFRAVYSGASENPLTVSNLPAYWIGRIYDFTSVGSAMANTQGDNKAADYFGYFRPSSSGVWKFLFTTVDDDGYFWFGSKALGGFSGTNWNAKGQTGASNTYSSPSLTAGSIYPIRIHYADNGGSQRLNFQAISPSGSKFSNLDDLVFSCSNGFQYTLSGCVDVPYALSGLFYRLALNCANTACVTDPYYPINNVVSTGFTTDFGSLDATIALWDSRIGKTIDFFGYIMVPSHLAGRWTMSFAWVDDQAYMWFGEKAMSGYSPSNADLSGTYKVNSGRSGSFYATLTAGTYYPIRVFYGDINSDRYFKMQFHDGMNWQSYLNNLFSCSPGAYMTVSNGCQACPAGTYSTTYNSLSCTECQGNTYQNSVGQTSCKVFSACPSGQYRIYSSTSQSSCQAISGSGLSATGLAYSVYSDCNSASGCIDNPWYGSGRSPTATGVSDDFSSIQTATKNGITVPNRAADWVGFILVPAGQGGAYQLGLTGVYNQVYVWIGDNAISGYDWNGRLMYSDTSGAVWSPTIDLAAGQLYPIRIHYGSFYKSFGMSFSIKLVKGAAVSRGGGMLATCSKGYFSNGYSCQICPAGSFSSEEGASTGSCSVCPIGSYCPVGAVNPTICPMGSSCRLAGASAPVSCPAGSYSNALGLSSCLVCPEGFACSGSTISPLRCASVTFADEGSSVCTPCYNRNGPLPSGLAPSATFFEGGPAKYQCICAVGYTGDYCQLRACSDSLIGGSLGALLFHSDLNLAKYSREFNKTSSQIFDATQYLKSLLYVMVDMDGDGSISTNEMVASLTFRSVGVQDLNLPIWCTSAVRGSYCYNNKNVDVDSIFNDAINNFMSSEDHTFDGSGVPILRNLNSTFPSPSWSADSCSRYDQSRAIPNQAINASNQVNTTWVVSDRTKLRRVCGYTNGRLDKAFNAVEALTMGKQDYFVDLTYNRTAIARFKRVYCLSVEYENANRQIVVSYECSVGLFYDGTPLDLQPLLNEWGVAFSFLDTSISEKQFDVFVGDFGSSDSDKQLIVGIPYASEGCGRVSNHISYLDTQSRKRVGQIREYGVRAVGQSNSSSMTVMPYRIPFHVVVSGSVATLSGLGVPGAIVKYCRIDPNTGLRDKNTDFCPLKTFVTDLFGSYSGEIRVSHPKWTNSVEYFNVSVELTEVVQGGMEIEHVFVPPSMGVALSHSVGTSTISFQDNTTVSVFGSVKFDPANVNGFDCPFAGVPVILMLSKANLTTTTAADGTWAFNYSITRGEEATVLIPPYNNHTWKASLVLLGDVSNRRLLSSDNLLHSYEFLISDGKSIYDSIDRSYSAILGGAAALKDGQIVLRSTGTDVSFVQLPDDLSFDAPFSVEVWGYFDTFNKDTTLFSFAKRQRFVSFSSDFGLRDPGLLYVAMVYRPLARLSQVYVNGELYSESSGATDFIASNISACFIGRNATGTTSRGVNALIESVRMWKGSLSASDILDNYMRGRDFSEVQIPRALTASTQNIRVQFYATAMQFVDINFFGGLKEKVRLFGRDTMFDVNAVDPMCLFSAPTRLADSSATVLLPAMNYVVTLATTPLSPVFAENTCYQEKTCFCDVTKSPRDFLIDSNTLSQSLNLANGVLAGVRIQLDYIYLTGLCFEVAGSQDFSLTQGDSTIVPDQTCFNKSTFRMNKGDLYTVEIKLFERYPSTLQSAVTSTTPIVIETYVPDATIDLSDLVSSIPALQEIPYDPIKAGEFYTITAADPRASAPYVLSFMVAATRNSPDGGSYVKQYWFVPVLGSIPSEVPDYFPVATDPTLIYLVLRDPPGGASYSSLHAGTQVHFDMSIDGMSTYSGANELGISVNAGADVEMSTAIAPLGIGIDFKVADIKLAIGAKLDSVKLANVERTSSAAYTYSMQFDYEFKTSEDPNIAGHPSDMIVGGGVDIIVSQAIEVSLGNTTASLYCVRNKDAFMWQPGRMTTYALPVIEIEDIISQLARISKALAVSATADDISAKLKIDKQMTNWKTVLSNYRGHNEDLTAMFTAEQRQFNDLAAQYKLWKTSKAGTLVPPKVGLLPFSTMRKTFAKALSECSELNSIIATSKSFASQVCDDVSTNGWVDFWRSLNGACDMPDTNFKSSLSDSTLLDTFCRERKAAAAADIPGGLESSDDTDSVFGFLKNSKKYVTYSANAPVSLSWTSSVQDSITTTAAYSTAESTSLDAFLQLGITGAGAHYGFNLDSTMQNDLSVSIGKSMGSSRAFDRTVHVVLDDHDTGDYFAVRITEDSVFGTPVFKTMGGQSQCPGETATQRRQSRVTIKQIIHRCGTDRNTRCDERTLKRGDPASFGLVIENLSPTQDEVDYTIQLTSRFDKYNPTAYSKNLNSPGYCGASGQRGGLTAQFVETDLRRIPYNSWIEVPFTVQSGFLCDEFNDIEVQIIATCEIPTTSSSVYQYMASYDPSTREVAIDYSDSKNYRAANSTATFSVAWGSSVPRRLLSDGEGYYASKTSNKTFETLSIVAIALSILCILYIAISKHKESRGATLLGHV